MGNRNHRNGRSKYPDGQFWQLPYKVARHDAFRALSGNAVKVLIELHCRYIVRGDGSTNNGEITLSLGEASSVLNIGKATAQRALKELETAGFIRRTRTGHWYGRQASEFELTDLPSRGKPPTRDWQHMGREKQNAVPIRTTKPLNRSVSEPALN